MSKFIVGTTLGLAAGYLAAKMMDENFMEKVSSEVNDFTAKAKKKAKNLMDKGANEAEYIKDKAEYAADKGKAKIENAVNY